MSTLTAVFFSCKAAASSRYGRSNVWKVKSAIILCDSYSTVPSEDTLLNQKNVSWCSHWQCRKTWTFIISHVLQGGVIMLLFHAVENRLTEIHHHHLKSREGSIVRTALSLDAEDYVVLTLQRWGKRLQKKTYGWMWGLHSYSTDDLWAKSRFCPVTAMAGNSPCGQW